MKPTEPCAHSLRVMEAVEAWQNYPMVHDLTCGNDSRHKPLQAKLLREDHTQWSGGCNVSLTSSATNERVILVCPDCWYTQTWIPESVLGFSKAKAREMEDWWEARGLPIKAE